MKQQPTAVLDVGTSKVVCAIGWPQGSNSAEVLAYGVGQHKGIVKGQLEDPKDFMDATQEAIANAEELSGVRVRELVVGVPGCYVRSALQRRSVAVASRNGSVTQREVDLIMKSMRKVPVEREWVRLHSVLRDYSLDNGETVSHPLSHVSTELSAMFSLVVGEREFIDGMSAVCRRLRVEIQEFVAVPQAQALFMIPQRDRMNVSVLVDVGMYATDVTVMHKNAIVYHWSLDIGGANIAADIAQGLDVSLEEAEQLKRKYVFEVDNLGEDYRGEIPEDVGLVVTKGKVSLQDIVEARIDELAFLIQEILQESGARMDERSRVYLTGGGLAMMRGGREYLAERLDMPVRVFTIDDSILYSPNYYSAVSLLLYDSKAIRALNCDWMEVSGDMGRSRFGLLDKIRGSKRN